MLDLIIVGAGPAGLTAAIYAKRANLSFILIEKNAPGGQVLNTDCVDNYPGYERINGADLAIKMVNHALSLGTDLVFDEVTQIEKENDLFNVVTVSNKYPAKTVLLATGLIPRKLGIESESKLISKGIHFCAVCDGSFYKDEAVIVIGGGNSAVEEAIYLAKLAKSVTMIQNLGYFTADPKAIERLLSHKNVTCYFNSNVEKFIGDKHLESVVIQNNQGEIKEINAKGAFEYIGWLPNSKVVNSLKVNHVSGYIETNDTLETNIEGLFVAGDLRNKQVRQIVTATADGAMAIHEIIKYLDNRK